jgi:hypothetical protein
LAAGFGAVAAGRGVDAQAEKKKAKARRKRPITGCFLIFIIDVRL